MGRKKLDRNKQRLPVTISIGPALREKIDLICYKTQESRGKVLEKMLIHHRPRTRRGENEEQPLTHRRPDVTETVNGCSQR